MSAARLGAFCLAIAVAFVGCTSAGRVGLPASTGDLVMLGTPAGIRALDASTGRTSFDAGRAVAAADWSTLVGSVPADGGSRLRVVDATSGAERFAAKLGASLEVRVVSPDGRYAALMPPRADGATYGPEPRERSAIVVANLESPSEPRRLELDGNLEPEAFSVDDSQLFVLEWLPAMQPERYRVQRISLATGTREPTFTRQKTLNLEEMSGVGRQHVLAPDRQTLYTLYTKQPDHVHARDMLRGPGDPAIPMVHAFVHALGLDWGWTYCLDLPVPMGIGPSVAHAIAVAPGGATLYVADLSSGTVVRVDREQLRITRTAAIAPDPAPDRGASSVVGPDGTLYVGGSTGVTALDGATLRPKARFELPDATAGLALSPDGRRLYIGGERAVAVLDPATGRELGRLRPGAFDAVRHVNSLAIR